MAKPVPEPSDNYKQVRNHYLTTYYKKFGVEPPAGGEASVWSVIMEIGYANAVVTLICAKDGTADLYLGTGGGVTGGGAYEEIRAKAQAFLDEAQKLLKKLQKTKNFPLPEVDRVRFYARTFDGVYTTQSNRHIDSENHELFTLFRRGYEVIAAIRAVDDAGVTAEKTE